MKKAMKALALLGAAAVLFGAALASCSDSSSGGSGNPPENPPPGPGGTVDAVWDFTGKTSLGTIASGLSDKVKLTADVSIPATSGSGATLTALTGSTFRDDTTSGGRGLKADATKWTELPTASLKDNVGSANTGVKAMLKFVLSAAAKVKIEGNLTYSDSNLPNPASADKPYRRIVVETEDGDIELLGTDESGSVISKEYELEAGTYYIGLDGAYVSKISCKTEAVQGPGETFEGKTYEFTTEELASVSTLLGGEPDSIESSNTDVVEVAADGSSITSKRAGSIKLVIKKGENTVIVPVTVAADGEITLGEPSAPLTSNVDFLTADTDKNVDLSGITEEKWVGGLLTDAATADNTVVNVKDGVLTLNSPGEAAAYYVLPTAKTTGKWNITAKVIPGTAKNSWTFLQLIGADNKDAVALRTTATDKLKLRTNGSTLGTTEASFAKDTEYEVTFNLNLNKHIVTATFGSTTLGTKVEIAEDFAFKAIKVFANNSGVELKDLKIEEDTTADEPVAVTGVTIKEGATLELEVGDEKTLTAQVEPTDADNKAVTWASDNASVATVDANSGKVEAKAVGTANVTVTTADGNKTATIAVTVKEKLDKVSYFTATSGTLSYAGTQDGTFLTGEDASYSDLSGTMADGSPKIAKNGNTTGCYFEAANATKNGDWITFVVKVKASDAGSLKKFSYTADSGQQVIGVTASYSINGGTAVSFDKITASAKGTAINANHDMSSCPKLSKDDEVTFKIVIGTYGGSGKGTSKGVIRDIVIGGVAD